METPGILLILFIIVLVLVFLITMFFIILRRKNIYQAGWKIILFILVFLVYFFIGYFIYQYVLLPIYDMLPKKDMIIWDNIWYAIFTVFIMLLLAAIIKTVRDNRIRVGLTYFSLGTLTILIVYTIMYYIFMFNESLSTITFVLFLMSAGLAILMIIITRFIGTHSRLLLPFYLLFSLACIVFLICLLWLICRAIEEIYNRFVRK